MLLNFPGNVMVQNSGQNIRTAEVHVQNILNVLNLKTIFFYLARHIVTRQKNNNQIYYFHSLIYAIICVIYYFWLYPTSSRFDINIMLSLIYLFIFSLMTAYRIISTSNYSCLVAFASGFLQPTKTGQMKSVIRLTFK